VKVKVLILFVLVGIASSLFRFGDRENDLAIVSDSDYYLDMAQVFTGQKDEFDKNFLKVAPHHYNRPLLPFCAGILGHFLLNDNYAAAFSIINIIAAILIAYLFFLTILEFYPKIIYPWFPSLLFLTSFSQMDFGYHILTETIGLAFAFGTCYLIYRFLLYYENKTSCVPGSMPSLRDWRIYAGLALLLTLQVFSFLARETAWFAFIFIIYVIIKRRLYRRQYIVICIMTLIILVVAKIPQVFYSALNNTHIPKFAFDFNALIAPDYISDTVLKLGLTFNISWLIVIPAVYSLIKGRLVNVHEFFIAWSFGAFGYIAAGYLHNSVLNYGYPLRMFFSLFPVIYIWVIQFFEYKFKNQRLVYILGLFFLFHVCVSIVGLLVDTGTGTIHTIFDIFKS
jgi:hypothetical protein